MRELAELAKRDFERLKTTYIMRETNGEVIDLYKSQYQNYQKRENNFYQFR